MALYHKWDVNNGFTYVLQFLSLISGGVGGVLHHRHLPAFSNSSPEAEPAMEFMETAENEGGLAPMAMMTVIVSFHQRQGH